MRDPIEGQERKTRGPLTQWVRVHRPPTRLIVLTIGLVVFLVFLPPYLRTAFWSSLIFHKIQAGMLLIFILLAISLVWSTGQRLDTWAFLFFNIRGHRPIWLDRIMLGLTQIGSGIAAMGFAIVLFLAGDQLLSYRLILGTLTLWLVVELVKFLANRSRPNIRVAQMRIVGYQAPGRSFPSGHTSQVFFMASLLAQHFRAHVWFVGLLYAAALLVGVTRLYVGAHYPRDVLAGAMLGSVWGLLGEMIL